MITYLVGGAVRDMFLGRYPKDLDYVVVGSSNTEMLELGFNQVGKDFPVFLHPETGDEYSLARRERNTGTGYHDFEVQTEGVSLKEDLARRDLTINAVAVIPFSDMFVDPHNGIGDISNKVLRHVSEAFVEDPLRVLRLYRLHAELGPEWTIAPETEELVHKMMREGLDLSPERVWQEMYKALKSDNPELFFGCGFFKEFTQLWGVPQSPVHHPEGCVGTHTVLTMREVLGDPLLVFAAMCHDFGKPITHAKYGKAHGHEQAGLPVISAFCDKYKVPNKYRKLALLVSEYRTKVHSSLGRGSNSGLTAKSLLKLVTSLGGLQGGLQVFGQVLKVCRADSDGRGSKRPYPQEDYLFEIQEELQKLNLAEVAANAPIGKVHEAVHAARLNAIKKVKATW